MKKDDAKQLADQAIRALQEELKAGRSESLLKYLDAMSRFHNYSWNNCMLIALQMPEATFVAGFRRWLQMGRHVRKGGTGIGIMAPLIYRSRDDSGADTSPAVDKSKAAERSIRGFKIVHVFDVSQTDGEELPQFAAITGDPGELLSSMEELIRSTGIILKDEVLGSGIKGVSRQGEIAIAEGLPAAERCSVLAHELAHLCNEADYVVIMCNVLEGKDRPLWRSTHNSETVQSDLRNAISVGSSCQGFVEADPPTSQAASALAFASRSISA
jgi:hypothetical protein